MEGFHGVGQCIVNVGKVMAIDQIHYPSAKLWRRAGPADVTDCDIAHEGGPQLSNALSSTTFVSRMKDVPQPFDHLSIRH
jgi:hypothetical protein